MVNDREKLIKDLRFFERGVEDRYGHPMPEHLGSLYPVVDGPEVGVLGSRYALKLAERGFRTRGYHHEYVTITPLLAAGEVRLAERQLEDWLRFVDVGMPPPRWPRERAEEQSACLLRAATRVLEHLCAIHALDRAPLAGVEGQLLEHGPELEITRLVKETAALSPAGVVDQPGAGGIGAE